MLMNSSVLRYNSPVAGSFLALEVKRHLLWASFTASLTSCDFVMLAMGSRRSGEERDTTKERKMRYWQ